jgi:hypothetical protein
MSARAAARLETLEFTQVYRYQPGRADWFAAGLPREGRDAHTRRVADIADRNVPICSIKHRITDVRDRLSAADDLCVVVDRERVVLGIVAREALDGDADRPVEDVMQANPVTFRPHVEAGKLPEYVRTQEMRRALVTTSDGVLIGLLRL